MSKVTWLKIMYRLLYIRYTMRPFTAYKTLISVWVCSYFTIYRIIDIIFSFYFMIVKFMNYIRWYCKWNKWVINLYLKQELFFPEGCWYSVSDRNKETTVSGDNTQLNFYSVKSMEIQSFTLEILTSWYIARPYPWTPAVRF